MLVSKEGNISSVFNCCSWVGGLGGSVSSVSSSCVSSAEEAATSLRLVWLSLITGLKLSLDAGDALELLVGFELPIVNRKDGRAK